MHVLTPADSGIIEMTASHVQSELESAEGGHDWWHVYRVWQTARQIVKQEGGNVNPLVVELGALLHDIADSKFHNGNEDIGPQKARQLLKSFEVDEEVIVHIEAIIRNISFKGGNERQALRSPELDIVQDADRLDALGAIGIARAFNYGGFKNRKLYDPAIPPRTDKTKEEYKQSAEPTLNHFYEKLFLLRDRMNTETGRRMAEERHRFMETYIEQFYREWNAAG